MKLTRDCDADAPIQALSRFGYRAVRQTGSHVRLLCEARGHALTVPRHRPLRVGTLAAILGDVGAAQDPDRAELLQRLFG